MFFSQSDIARIKERLDNNSELLNHIETYTAKVREKLHIQKSGLATWSHYFVCPACGVRFVFDYDNNTAFTCVNCGHTVSGEPYLGAWWEEILGLNSSSAYYLSIACVSTQREDYRRTVRDILLGYADNYKNYEVHGGIPYNKPGRFAAQVLSDAAPLLNLANAYALSRDFFTDSEREHIENDLFREAARHQMDHLTPQIHNHEVVIAVSIAAIGLAIGDRDMVREVLNMKYGLKYQIDHGYLSDDLWFECCLGYHLYPLGMIIRYEQMAKDTEFSLFADPGYRNKLYRALVLPLKFHWTDNRPFLLNDGAGGYSGYEYIYEYPYAYFKTDELAALVRASYTRSSTRRSSITALIYGADTIPEGESILPEENYIAEGGSNLAIVRSSEGSALLFKATPYAGEHDHYDRLGIGFYPFGTGACRDFGTSDGYGSPLHYAYYKNSATHNTVVIDGENMAPCDTVINEYKRVGDEVYLDAKTLPPEQYEMLDSFTIKQWSTEAYEGVTYRRALLSFGDCFIDIFSVKSKNNLRKEWILHIDGERVKDPQNIEKPDPVSKKGPQSYLKDCTVMSGEGFRCTTYSCDGFKLDVHSYLPDCDLVFALGPSNPADSDCAYHMVRSYSDSPVFVNVIDAYRDTPTVATVSYTIDQNTHTVSVADAKGRVHTLKIEL